ncbi:O51F2 protein, partial [Picathartes gymnocephalus]|nr:O51F2 protein [Picathartes gymnocephalus]
SFNRTGSGPLPFMLAGIPGVGASSSWVAVPLCCLYLLALLGNSCLLWALGAGQLLHSPMFHLLALLALADLGLALCTLPTVLAASCGPPAALPFGACLAQMYFIHAFSAVESGLLLAMAFDRFVAICHPLRYGSVLGGSLLARAGLLILLRGLCVVLPVAVLMARMPFCGPRVLSHSFCLHQDLLRLACGDVRPSSWYGLSAVILTEGLDSLAILLSYALIVRAILGTVAPGARAKAFSTCLSHLCAVLIFYIPLISLSVTHRFGQRLPPLTHTLLADACLLVPPVLNPLVYSWRTKQIRQRVLLLLCHRHSQQQ